MPISPLYLHVLSNHIPELGLFISLLALAIGFAFRSVETRRTGLILVFICSASAYPVVWSGQKGYDAIYFSIEKEDRAWLDAHMAVAEHWAWAFYALALLAVLSFSLPLKWPKCELALSLAVLLIGCGVFALSAYISYLGGRVRHIEFRDGPPPAVEKE